MVHCETFSPSCRPYFNKKHAKLLYVLCFHGENSLFRVRYATQCLHFSRIWIAAVWLIVPGCKWTHCHKKTNKKYWDEQNTSQKRPCINLLLVGSNVLLCCMLQHLSESTVNHSLIEQHTQTKDTFFYACSMTSDGKTPDVLFCGFKQCSAVQHRDGAASGSSSHKKKKAMQHTDKITAIYIIIYVRHRCKISVRGVISHTRFPLLCKYQEK